MGIELKVEAFCAADAKWHEMAAVWRACDVAGVEPPYSVTSFFDGDHPDDIPGQMVLLGGAITPLDDENKDGFMIALDAAPNRRSLVEGLQRELSIDMDIREKQGSRDSQCTGDPARIGAQLLEGSDVKVTTRVIHEIEMQMPLHGDQLTELNLRTLQYEHFCRIADALVRGGVVAEVTVPLVLYCNADQRRRVSEFVGFIPAEYYADGKATRLDFGAVGDFRFKWSH